MKRYSIWMAAAVLLVLWTACSRKDPLQAGAQAVKRGDYAKAVPDLIKARQQDSLNPEIHYNLCLAYAHLDSAYRALASYADLNRLAAPQLADSSLKMMMLNLVRLDPYPSSPVVMKGLANQFKGAPSPDGELIAVVAARTFLSDIYLVKYDGTVVKKITRGYMNNDPSFSPAGEHLIFNSDRDGDDELYLYDMKSGDVTKLTDNAYSDFAPCFSPNGIEAVFVTNRDGNWELYKINVHNRKTQRLTSNKIWDGFPSYTPDGKHIVYSSKAAEHEDIFFMKEDGSEIKLLYGSPANENDPHLYGNDLFFKTDRDGEWEIYRFNLISTALTRLTKNGDPDWNIRLSGDGTRLVYSRSVRGRWRLYFMNLTQMIPAGMIAEAGKDSSLVMPIKK